MQIVIDIPKEIYDEIHEKNYYSLKGKEALRVGVMNCIVLPEHHGRLIDADVYKWDNRDIIDCEINHPKFEVTLEELIDDALTVVETNKIMF